MRHNQHIRYKRPGPIFLLLCLSTLFVACQKTALPPNTAKILGHGGMGVFSAYPINSMESLLAAHYVGADGVEIDVQLSRDGVPIAFHDERLDRSTSLSGRIADKIWAELAGGFYTALPYQAYSIVSLEQVLRALQPAPDFWYALDCKSFQGGDTTYPGRLSEALLALIDRYGLQNRMLIESGDTVFLNRMKAHSGLQTYYLGNDVERSVPIIRQQGYTGLAIDFSAISGSGLGALQDSGVKVILFNAQNKQDNAEALEKGPDFLETDRLKALLNRL